ncbi:MAG: tetratricopeptide repeat protein [Brevinematia bacterium]
MEDLETASGYFKMILAEFPNNPSALLNLGKIYYERKDYLKAKNYLEKFITLKHDKPEAYLILSKCFYNLENYQKAFDYLSLWLEKSDNISNDLYNENLIFLSDIYFNLKKFQEAINILKPLLEDEKFVKETLLRIVKIYIKMNDFDKATNLANDYLIKIPKDDKIPILYELANAYVGKNEIYSAIEIWKGIKSLSPKFRDVIEILEKYKILDENNFLKNYFTSDDIVFADFIIKNFQIKEFQIYHRNDVFWVIKEENLCNVLYR